jgi:ABC-type sugar transport system ATPase subunit
VVENATLPTLNNFTGSGGLLRQKSRFNRTVEFGKRVNLKPLHVRKAAMDFSGGNQQKLVIEKWTMADATVYIFDEPTKGVDIGAKTEIYSIMNSRAEAGAAVIMVSSEMQEILGMSNTVLVMYEGRQTGYQDEHQELSHEKLMILGTGGTLDG